MTQPSQHKQNLPLGPRLNEYIITVVLGLLLIGTAIASLFSYAQGTDRGLIISPPIIEATLVQGQTAKYSLRLENDSGSSSIKLKAYLNKVSIDEQDNPLLEPVDPSDPLNQLIQLQVQEFTLAPKEVKNLDFLVNQPVNSLNGSLAAIIFEPITPDSAANGIDIKQRLSTLVFVQTPRKDGDPTPTFQVINTKADLAIVDPFLDTFGLSYQVYNPTSQFIKVDSAVNHAPVENSLGRKTILPFGTRMLNITGQAAIQLPKWLQKVVNPRFDQSKIPKIQDLTGGKIFGEQILNLNNNQPEKTQAKIWIIPWKTTLILIILLSLLISLYYTSLWLLAKIKINGKELVSTPNVSKRLPVIICFGIALICLTLLLVVQVSIPRIDLSENKINTDLPLKNLPKNQISLNENFATNPIIVGRGFKTDIAQKSITIDDTNCQTPEFPARLNGCYLDIDLSKITTPQDTKVTQLILGQLSSKNIQVQGKSNDGQDITLQTSNQDLGQSNTVAIDTANPNLDKTKPIQIGFWQTTKDRAITINNIIISYNK
ncbi:MAG: hypothetical protein H7230_04310 [Candidatus Parcubacteria bacterium]|nr:hypothetical protein [Candidatus Paceibacterota bacterium]